MMPMIAVSSHLPCYRLGEWSALRLQLLFAYERDMELGGRALRMTTSFQSLILVRRGWIEIRRASGRRVRASQGEWILMRQGLRYQRLSEDCRLLSIGFRFQTPTGEAIYESGLPLVFAASDHPVLKREAMRVLRVMGERIGLGYFPSDHRVALPDYLAAQNAFRDCFSVLAGVLAGRGVSALDFEVAEERVARFLELLDRFGPGDSWTVRALARQMGLSVTHLDRLVVAATGETARQHMDHHRRARAREALRNQATPIKAIAYQLGFATAAHFSAWFRKAEGVTPGEYRQAAGLGG